MKIIAIFLLCYFTIKTSDGKVWEVCELARELHKNRGFSRDELPDWMCLIEHESSYNSKAVGGPNTDGSYDWGLWQINDRYWCTPGSKGKACNLDCNSMLHIFAV